METVTSILPSLQSVLYATPAVVCGLVIFAFIFKHFVSNQKRASSNLPPVPEVPGWPVIGNLLQLNEKKPHMTFAKWAETYGPIYSIKTGAYTVVVLNTTELAKEAMVTRFSSISTRKLSKAWNILTQDKCMVATSDYNEYHKKVKRYARARVFGPNAQRRHRGHRDTMVENITSQLRAHLNTNPKQPVNFREIFKFELFGLAMKEAVGEDVESVYSDELGISLSREELFTILVLDPLEGSIEVDWREFFPYLRWIPNQSFDGKLGRIHFRKHAVMTALIEEKKKRIASGQETDCFLDFLLSEGKTLTEVQIETLIWETIIGSSETTMVTVEWAMYELAKNTVCQDKLYHEIKHVCGSKKMEEEHLPQLPYLNAVFHETLRKYSPAPLVPLRFVHEDTELGGYHVPAGTEIAINIYGCNMDKKQWENPEDWKPERFLDGNFDPMDFLKTMAFGAGKRTCGGVLQATLIGCTSIGRQIQEFEWRLNDEVEENVNTLAFTSRKLHPFYAMIKRRSQ